jgi:hypothetical protein
MSVLTQFPALSCSTDTLVEKVNSQDSSLDSSLLLGKKQDLVVWRQKNLQTAFGSNCKIEVCKYFLLLHLKL